MRFADLYDFACTFPGAVPVRALAGRVTAFHPTVGRVEMYRVELDPTVSLGHVKQEKDRTSPYEEEFTVWSIRFDSSLNRCWARFVCCKELMHVYDTPDEVVDSREKFLELMGEFGSPRMAEDASPMYQSELRAQWKAMFCLAPKPVRDEMCSGIRDGSLTHYNVASLLKIPEATVPGLLSDYYEDALARALAGEY